jgi:Transmembrane secretion effector
MRLLADIRPLREFPQFRRLWAGGTCSAVGGAMTGFAVMLQVYDLTGSAFAVGALGLFRMIPTLGVGLFGGSLADGADRRRLVLVTSSCLAAVSALLAAQSFAGLKQLWLLYALVAVESALLAIDGPARRTFTPRLLPRHLLPAGLALNHLTFQICLTVGPALAGLVTAAAGLRMCYLIDAVSFGAALYAVARLPAMTPLGGVTRPGPRAVAEAVRFIRRSQVLAGAFLADLNATVLGLPVALFPAINAQRFGGAAQTLGLLTAAIGAGGLAGSACSGPVGHVARPGRAMLWTVTVWGGAIAGFAVTPRLWPALSLLAVAGAADTTTVVLRGTIVQSATPDRLRGRVTAADYVVGAGGGELGNLESGAIGSLASPTVSALSGGLATIAGAILIRLALPCLASYDFRRRARTGPSGGEGCPPDGEEDWPEGEEGASA